MIQNLSLDFSLSYPSRQQVERMAEQMADRSEHASDNTLWCYHHLMTSSEPSAE